MGQLVGCIEGMAAACRALDFPVVSGNVSLYNETDGNAILPTPNVGGLGLIERPGRAWSASPGASPASILILLGECLGWLGCSLYWSQLVHRDDGAPPPVDLAAERRTGEFLLGQIAAGQVRACHDLSDGGLAVAAAEMCLASGMGATLELARRRGQRLRLVVRRGPGPLPAGRARRRCRADSWPRPARPACSPARSAGPAATR